MIRVLLRCLFVLLLAAPGAAQVDQTDSRLDQLFARLQVTDDFDEARVIEQAIWATWIRTDDELLNLEIAAGIDAMERGNAPEALRIFDKVVERAPKYAEGWNKRATLYYFMSAYEASIADVERTLALEPRHFGALAGLGLIYAALGEDKKALEAMERALKVHPHLPGVRANVDALRKKLRGKPI